MRFDHFPQVSDAKHNIPYTTRAQKLELINQ